MYVKLFDKILDSSIWLEPDPVRIAWITMLAAMDEDGFCGFASAKNLARRANISVEDAQRAVDTFEAPDPDSSDPEFEGRRVERVPGGWLVLNAKKYQEIAKREQLKVQIRERVRKHRAKHSGNANVTQANENVTPLYVDVPAALPEPKSTPPLPPKKSRRRSKEEIIAGYTQETRNTFDKILQLRWPGKRKDGSEVVCSEPQFLDRLETLLKMKDVTADLLIKSARLYLQEKPSFPSAPQFFFGPGNGKSANWKTYAKMVRYEEEPEESEDFSLSAAESDSTAEIGSGEVWPERGKN